MRTMIKVWAPSKPNVKLTSPTPVPLSLAGGLSGSGGLITFSFVDGDYWIRNALCGSLRVDGRQAEEDKPNYADTYDSRPGGYQSLLMELGIESCRLISMSYIPAPNNPYKIADINSLRLNDYVVNIASDWSCDLPGYHRIYVIDGAGGKTYIGIDPDYIEGTITITGSYSVPFGPSPF